MVLLTAQAKIRTELVLRHGGMQEDDYRRQDVPHVESAPQEALRVPVRMVPSSGHHRREVPPAPIIEACDGLPPPGDAGRIRSTTTTCLHPAIQVREVRQNVDDRRWQNGSTRANLLGQPNTGENTDDVYQPSKRNGFLPQA